MVRQLLDHLGPGGDLAVVGHDIGGGVAQLLALEGGVRTMVLLDAVSFDSWPIEGVRMIQRATPEQATPEFAERIVRLAVELGMGRPERLPPEDLEAYLSPWLEDPMALIRAARAIDGVGLLGTEERLAELECRTLVVWGEDDPYQPSELAERLGEVIPTATVALLPGCSHLVTEDAPEEVIRLVFEYLRTHHLGESHGHPAGPTPVELGVSFTRPDRPQAPDDDPANEPLPDD
jgi:pimeloyl-ACP methyl ester carboxylesterase